jgi:hypothetical protein
MKLNIALLATGFAAANAGSTGFKEDSSSLRKSRSQAGAKKKCSPRSIEGVWTHMSQGLSFYESSEGGGLREWIVTCPRLPLWNGPQGGTKKKAAKDLDNAVVWGDGSCQIADANKQIDPINPLEVEAAEDIQAATNAQGCGWVGVLRPEDMYIDADYDACAFFVVLKPKGGCNFPLGFRAIQDHENMWWLYLNTDGSPTEFLNAGNPRHTTRNPTNTGNAGGW